MDAQAIDMLDGGRLPECPDCRRSRWEVLREKLAGTADRSVEVRCADCGSAGMMVRQGNQPDWRLVSLHRG